jgi:hypothetical protein
MIFTLSPTFPLHLPSRKFYARKQNVPLCFQLLAATPEPPAEEHPSSTEDTADLYRCPKCGGPMKIIERLTAAEIQPPFSTRVNRCCMKPLSPTRKLCVPRRAPHFSTSSPHLFPSKPLQRPSSPRFFGSRQLWPWQCEGPCSAAQPRHISNSPLLSIEFA